MPHRIIELYRCIYILKNAMHFHFILKMCVVVWTGRLGLMVQKATSVGGEAVC